MTCVSKFFMTEESYLDYFCLRVKISVYIYSLSLTTANIILEGHDGQGQPRRKMLLCINSYMHTQT